MPAETGDYTVTLALVLHLQHHALVRLVRPGVGLGDHSVEPRPLESPEPVLGDRAVARCGRYVQRLDGIRENALEHSAPLAERLLAQVPIAFAQEVEEDDRRGGLFSEQFDSR